MATVANAADTRAVRADDFLNSLGANSAVSRRGERLTNTISAARFLGLRWFRVGYESSIPVTDLLKLHEETGVRFSHGLMSGGTNWSRLLEGARQLAAAGALIALEGNNEPNNWGVTYEGVRGGRTNSWLPVAKLQRDLYRAVKSVAVLKDYPVWSLSENGAQTDNVGLQFLTIPAPPRADMTRLIHLAGTTHDEMERLRLLRELEARTDLDATLRADLTKLLPVVDDWADGKSRVVVDHSRAAENGKPAGVLPSAIRWPHGGVAKTDGPWWEPFSIGHNDALYNWPGATRLMTSTLLLAYHTTREERYLEPIRSMAALRVKHLQLPEGEPGSGSWCARRMSGFLPDALAKYRLLTGDTQYDPLLRAAASGYVRYRLTGDAAPLEAAELYHFGAQPRDFEAELFLLSPGDYRLILTATGTDNATPLQQRVIHVEGPRVRVSLELPARRLCLVKVSRQ